MKLIEDFKLTELDKSLLVKKVFARDVYKRSKDLALDPSTPMAFDSSKLKRQETLPIHNIYQFYNFLSLAMAVARLSTTVDTLCHTILYITFYNVMCNV